MKTRRVIPTCDFCSTEIGEIELLFRSSKGGQPAAICSGCVAMFGEVIELNRAAPTLAAELIALNNREASASTMPHKSRAEVADARNGVVGYSG